MKCEQVRDWLRRDLDGAAEPSADAAAHLERCSECTAEAGRLQTIAAARRAAMPAAAVPSDFVDQTMAALVQPAGDAALAAAASPRLLRRWGPVLVAVLLVPLAALWFHRPAASGEVVVERGGEWVAADGAGTGEAFGVPRLGRAEANGIVIVGREASLLRATRPLELIAGSVRLETRDPAVVRTPLAEIRLRADTSCVATLNPDQENPEMSFERLKYLSPAVLSVAVLTGGATVVNAQGTEEVAEEETAQVEAGTAPAQVDKLRAQLAEYQRRLDELARLIEEQQQRERQGGLAPVADVPEEREVVVPAPVAEKGAVDLPGERVTEVRITPAFTQDAARRELDRLISRAQLGDEEARKVLRVYQRKLAEVLGENTGLRGGVGNAFGGRAGVRGGKGGAAWAALAEAQVAKKARVAELERELARMLAEVQAIADNAEAVAALRLAITQKERLLADAKTALAAANRLRLAGGIRIRCAGKITALEGHVARITIGKQQGVEVGNIVNVVRGATFIGSLRIEKVEAKQSAGRWIRHNRGAEPKVGDAVTLDVHRRAQAK